VEAGIPDEGVDHTTALLPAAPARSQRQVAIPAMSAPSRVAVNKVVFTTQRGVNWALSTIRAPPASTTRGVESLLAASDVVWRYTAGILRALNSLTWSRPGPGDGEIRCFSGAGPCDRSTARTEKCASSVGGRESTSRDVKIAVPSP
jgi:hypothetical protein